jgi:hypothetical protein
MKYYSFVKKKTLNFCQSSRNIIIISTASIVNLACFCSFLMVWSWECQYEMYIIILHSGSNEI